MDTFFVEKSYYIFLYDLFHATPDIIIHIHDLFLPYFFIFFHEKESNNYFKIYWVNVNHIRLNMCDELWHKK